LQGVNVTEHELKRAISRIKADARLMQEIAEYPEYKFVIDESTRKRMIAEQTRSALGNAGESTNESTTIAKDKKLADVTFWVLGCEKVSGNQISKRFKVSWRTADELLEILHKAGIVDSVDAKLPRNVITVCMDELSSKAIGFLEEHGYTQDIIREVIDSKQLSCDEGGGLL